MLKTILETTIELTAAAIVVAFVWTISIAMGA
jgi:hypothetical protein